MSTALPRTRYQVTVKGGRIGKARQVPDFKIEVKARPHDLDRIRDEVCRRISHYARTKGTDVALQLPPNTDAIYGDVYCDLSEHPIGRIKLELLMDEPEDD